MLSIKVKKFFPNILVSERLIFPFLAIIFFALFIRNSAAVYPGLLDEFYYNQYARLLPFSEAAYGNFLYYLIYRVTNACGDGFMSCAYFLNTIFYVSAFFPIYAIARSCIKKPLAIWVSFLAILAPYNIWTAFFMPESLYFLVFWLYIFTLLFFRPSNDYVRWLFVGLVLGICALVKIHAFFLLPASCLFILYLDMQKGKDWIKKSLVHMLCFGVSAVLIKLIIGYLLAGSAGLTLFGAYTDMVSQGADVLNHALSAAQPEGLDPYFSPLEILKRDGPRAIWINVLPIFLLYSLPIVVILISLTKITPLRRSMDSDVATRIDLVVISFLLIGSVVSIIAIFQLALMAKMMGQAELFWRYYEFSFPLLYLVAGACISDTQYKNEKYNFKNLVLICFVSGVVLWALFKGAGTQWVSMGNKPLFMYTIGVASITALAISIFRINLSLKIFIWIILPFILLVSNIYIYKEFKKTRMMPNDSSVGHLINSRLSKSDLSKLVVVQDNSLTQTVPMIFFNQAPIEFISIPESQKQYDLRNLPAGRDWVLLMGNHELVGDALNKTHEDLLYFGGMTLFGGHGDITIDFKKAQWKGLINKHSGLFNPPEPWGAWSIGNKIKIEFSKPLPRIFNVELTARAFGPNLSENFFLRVGSRSIPFKIRTFPEFEKVSILVENFSRSNIIEIDIPRPASPKDMGLGDDNRTLGIGLTHMHIKW
jgi:phosphoglycerol transferase